MFAPDPAPVDEKTLASRIENFLQHRGSVLRDKTYDEGFISTLIDSRGALQKEYGRLLDYWLCIHGLTFAQFRMGLACQEEGCDVGEEHVLGIAAERAEAAADLTQPVQEG